MHIDEKKSVGQLAAFIPQLIPLLEGHGIDYYCRGNRSLKEACELVGLDPAEIVPELTAAAKAKPADTSWMTAPLTDLTNHLIATYHARARHEIPALRVRAEEVCARYRDRHPELKRIWTLLAALCEDMLHHMRNEEEMLFPQVEALESAALESRPPEKPYVGGLSHRILVEYHEHDVVAEKMRKLRELTSNYLLPEDDPEYRQFYADMKNFERALHEHMHLENNVLYPRSGVLESNVKLHVAAPW